MASGIQGAQKAWFNDYSKQIQSGTNNVNDIQRYNDYAHYLQLQKVNPDTATLQRMSMNALNGDSTAQSYLKAMNQKQLSGSALWNGINPNSLQKHSGAYRQYILDNPLSNTARTSDTEMYNHYNQMIQNNQAMKQSDLDWYNQNLSKWNLDDMNNPYVQQQEQLKKDKQNALSAQDVALNQGMATMDANSFQQFQQLQQGMAQRGMSESGIATDAYMRAQMGNNANYQQAFAQGATKKSEIETQFNEALYKSKLSDYEMKVEIDKNKAEQAIKLQEIQNDQDKWLTESTGSVFINGQRIMVDGKPLTTVEWEKLSEEKRSNLAQEYMENQKNSWDYQLGQEKNALGWDANSIKRQQIAVDLQIATSKLQLDYSKLDFNYAKLESNNTQAQDKIRIASENAQTGADKAKITALGQQLSSLTSQITSYQKAGKKPPKALVDQYNDVTGQLQAMAGNFQVGSGGGM
jgi:hypothetical protein